MTQDPAAIAGKLSAAERRAIIGAREVRLRISPKHIRIELHIRAYRDGGVLARSIAAAGLTNAKGALNPLGLSVRRILKEQDRGE